MRAPPFVSVLLVVRCSVSVSPQDQSFCPRRCAAHLLTDRFDGYHRISFDNDLIVHVTADETFPQLKGILWKIVLINVCSY